AKMSPRSFVRSSARILTPPPDRTIGRATATGDAISRQRRRSGYLSEPCLACRHCRSAVDLQQRVDKWQFDDHCYNGYDRYVPPVASRRDADGAVSDRALG